MPFGRYFGSRGSQFVRALCERLEISLGSFQLVLT